MVTRTALRHAFDLDDTVGRAGRTACAVVVVVLVAGVWPATPWYPDALWARLLGSVVILLVVYLLGLAVIRAVRNNRRPA